MEYIGYTFENKLINPLLYTYRECITSFICIYKGVVGLGGPMGTYKLKVVLGYCKTF